MIDPGKKKALIEWVNALLIGECIESLKQLKDGIYMCKLVHLLDKDQDTELNSAEERFRMVTSVLENHYHVTITDKIDIPQIIEHGDEFEIAKMCLVLLCAGVFSERSIIEAATALEASIQQEIFDMIEPVLKPESEYQNLVFADNLESSTTILTPLQQMVSSPQMSTKMKLKQKEQRITRLVRELNAERHTRDELEAEIKELEKKDQIISDLQQQLKLAKRRLSTIQQSKETEMFAQNEDEIETLRQRFGVYINLLRVSRFRALNSQCSLYKDSLISVEKCVSQMNVALRDKENLVVSLTEANRVLESDLRGMQELYKNQQQEWRQAMETSIQNESGECLFGVVEKQLNEQIALLQESLDSEQGLKDQMNEQITLLQGSLANECRLKDELNDQIALLRSTLADERREKDKWQQEADSMKNKLEALNNDFISLQQCFESEKQQWSEISNKLQQELIEQKMVTKKEREELLARINLLTEQLNTTNETNSDLTKSLAMKDEENIALQQNYGELQNRLLNTKTSMKEEINKLNRDVVGLKEENTRLASDLNEVKELNRNLGVDVQNTETEKQHLKNQLCEIQASGQRKVQALEEQLQRLQTSYDNELLVVQSQLKEVQECKCCLQAELKNIKQSKSDLENVLSQETLERTKLKSKCNDLEKDLCQVKEAHQIQISQLNKELECSRFALQDTKQANNDFEKLLSQERCEQMEWKSKCCELDQELAGTKETCSTEIAQLYEKLETSQSVFQEMKQAKCDLGELFSQERCEHNKLEQEMAAAKGMYETQICQLNQKAEELQSELKALKQGNSDLENLVTQEYTERTNWQTKYRDLEQEMKNLQDEYQRQLTKMDKKTEAVQSEFQDLKQAKFELETLLSLEQTKQTGWKSKCLELQQEMNRAKETHQTLTGQLNETLDRLRLELEDTRHAKCSIEKLLSREESEKAEWQHKYSELEQELTVAKEEHREVISQLNEKLENMQLELEQMQQEKSNVEGLLSVLQRELTGCRSKLEEVEKEMNAGKVEYGAQLCQLNKDVETFQLELESVKQGKCNLEKLLSQEERQQTEWKSKCSELEQKMVAAGELYESEVCQLKNELETKKSELQDVKQAKDDVEMILSQEQYEWQSKGGDFEWEINAIKQRSESQMLAMKKELEAGSGEKCTSARRC
ncbi:hypothetical protein LSH36_281g01023 [Paralvinella palmiformis]|uniref:Nuclear mitotic apparatus protein 1 N-terminal hook domain-containing protein n=1 Tax=Paralvinella palmiformis TaxID=53620 RepID=A0AAD9N3B6_9ANNE|nr:hypothetical protein LSH36_281g01023 [Paralvinella palmiformis]